MTDAASRSIQHLTDTIARVPSATLRVWTDWACRGIDRPSLILTPWADPEIGSALMQPYARQPLGVARAESMATADVMVLPFDGQCMLDQPYGRAKPEAIDYAKKFVSNAKVDGLPTMAVLTGDSSAPLPVAFDIVLRTSVNQAAKEKGTYCLPGWYDTAQSIDPSKTIQPSPRGPSPRIAFCGQAAAPANLAQTIARGKKAVRHVAAGQLTTAVRLFAPSSVPRRAGGDSVDSLRIRRHVLRHLHACEKLTANFKIRDRFFHGIADKESARNEFVENMLDSDYVLCVRGFGNYSFRFYDALSNGRVPLLIDTDSALPFDFDIDYRALMPIIPIHALHRAEEIVLQHYQSFTNDEWLALQHHLRELFVSMLSPQGFFRNMGRIPEIKSLVNR